MHLFISNFKKIGKTAILLIFLMSAILLFLICFFSKTWRPKDNLYYFYQLDRNSLDVINIGSSHVYSSINTLQLYQQKGITSYNLSAGSQSAWYSYYYLTEALKTQSPKVILLDVYTLKESDDSQFAESAQLNLLSMKPSWNKWQAIMASDADDRINIFFGFPKNHISYRKLTVDDYENKTCLNMMGYAYSGIVEPLEQSIILDARDVKGISPITEKSELYLRKIIELCQQRDIEIVLVNAPWPYITEEDEEKYNYIEQIADEYGIDFINGCEMTEHLEMDYSIDNRDRGGHLNYSGSLKWTNYLMQYLSDNYSLPDHRPEHPPIWEESVRELDNMLVRDHLEGIDNVDEYLNFLADKQEYAYAVMVDSNLCLPNTTRLLLEKSGLELGDAQNGYLIRMPNGQLYSGADFTSHTGMFADMYDKINTYKEKDEEYHSLQMQFNNRIADERTADHIYFIVFDPFRNSALDTAEFREDNGYKRNM